MTGRVCSWALAAAVAAALGAAAARSAGAATALSHAAQARLAAHESKRLVPLLREVLRFHTVQGDNGARDAQQAWLRKTARELGLVAREAGLVTEVELAGPAGAPVLGLVVHGDVQPVEEKAWRTPPFAGALKKGLLIGRGAADDKGPLVQALLALAALKAAGTPLTHTVRLLVGSDEESDNLDLKQYLEGHAPPALALVLDADFPVTVGEKAWQALVVSAPPEATPRPGAERFSFVIESITAGLAASIVPDRATLALRWRGGAPDWKSLRSRLEAAVPDAGTRLLPFEEREGGAVLVIAAAGRSAHSGVNLAGGRNALVSLAHLLDGLLPPGPADDLLAFARLAGQDAIGSGLGLTETDPVWGRTSVSATLLQKGSKLPAKLVAAGQEASDALLVNLRRTPPLTGAQLKARLEDVVAAFNLKTGAHLVPGGYWDDEPLGFDPQAKLVRRLMQSYRRATGRDDPPAISGGGTYAKRLPNAIAFGMWFPDKPYPGHDVDESNPVADLELGTKALLEAVVDLACAPPLEEPFKR